MPLVVSNDLIHQTNFPVFVGKIGGAGLQLFPSTSHQVGMEPAGVEMIIELTSNGLVLLPRLNVRFLMVGLAGAVIA